MWQQMIQDIHAEGWTFQRIGIAVGLKRNSVHEIGTGETKQPKGEAAIKIIALHRLLMRRKKYTKK